MQMILTNTFVALAALAGIALAAPSTVGTLVHGPRVIPNTFQKLGFAAGVTPFTMTFHLNGANLDGLAAAMDQNAATLGNPFTMEQIASYASPSTADQNAVQSYLTSQGFTASQMTYSAFKDEVTVTTTVAKAASILGTTFHDYSFAGQTMPRALNYTIPSAISNSVFHVSPVTSFVNVKASPIKKKITPAKKRELWAQDDALETRATRAVPAGCSTGGVTPTCLRNLYQTSSYTPVAGANTDVFVAGFIGQYVSQSDLTSFLKTYRPAAAGYKIPIINVKGAVNLGIDPGVEAMLDVETVVSATYPLKSTFYNYGNQLSQGDIFGAAFNDIINNYAKYGKPGVYSISYGADENSVTQTEATAMCNSAMKLSAMGTTIVLSSGDNGVGGSSGDTCPPFVPTYPSGCPYILSVGATQNFSPEVAVDPSLAGFYSGAGFSNLFARPAYQNTAVTNYLNSIGTLDAGYYTKGGRGYPDISAQGSLYIITVMGQSELVSGTSCSAPTTSSVIALLNSARRQKGQGNVGYINPFFYSHNTTLTDVTSGSSKGCGNTTYGFPAKNGWDPSTGLGTPLFPNIRAAYGV
jgi:tripeptidyl-peptidase-1